MVMVRIITPALSLAFWRPFDKLLTFSYLQAKPSIPVWKNLPAEAPALENNSTAPVVVILVKGWNVNGAPRNCANRLT